MKILLVLLSVLTAAAVLAACGPAALPEPENVPVLENTQPAQATIGANAGEGSPTETQAPTDVVDAEPSATDEPVEEATNTPAPTKPVEPTDVPEPATAVPPPVSQDNGRFTLVDANGVPPEDIIRDMVTAVEGLGPGNCFDKNEPVFLNRSERFLMEAVYVSICGWNKGDEVEFTVYGPDGEVFQTKEKAEERDGQQMVRVRFQPFLTDPVGLYYFAVVSGDTRQEWGVTYQAPSGPHLYIVSEKRFRPLLSTDLDEYRLLFTGFEPGEEVRLFAYEPNGEVDGIPARKLAAWRDYTMDGDGKLQIQSTARNMGFIAWGPESGEVHLFTLRRGGGDLWDWFGSQDYYCPGSKEPRLKVFLNARVSGAELPLLEGPGLTDQVLETLPEGSQVNVNAGPRCADGVFWWQAFTEQNNGWVQESLDGEYVLEPE